MRRRRPGKGEEAAERPTARAAVPRASSALWPVPRAGVEGVPAPFPGRPRCRSL